MSLKIIRHIFNRNLLFYDTIVLEDEDYDSIVLEDEDYDTIVLDSIVLEDEDS